MRSAILALVLVAVAGCTLSAPVDCDDSEWGPELSCADVLAAAREQLPGDTGISRLEVRQGMHCPEDEPISCPNTPAVVTVYAHLLDGSRLFVTVRAAEDGRLSADPARAVEHGQ